MTRNVDFEKHVVKSGAPNKSEGYQGETQYRMVNGVRYMYVKIDNEWLATPLQTASAVTSSSAPAITLQKEKGMQSYLQMSAVKKPDT